MVALVALVALVTAGCAGAPQREPAIEALEEGAVGEAIPSLDERALLLLLVDRQLYEPYVVQLAANGGPELRGVLAMTLGRVGDPRGRRLLEGMLLDEEVMVRRVSAFALGVLGLAESKPALLRAVSDVDRTVGSLAIEALGKLKAPVLEVGDSLAAVSDEEHWPRLLPHLFRFEGVEKVVLARDGLSVADTDLRARAAYALGRDALADAAPTLRRLLEDPQPWIRGWAARGLGQVGEGADLELLLPLLRDSEPSPIIQALRAAGRLLEEGKAAAPQEWVPEVLRLMSAADPGVRNTAVAISGHWSFSAEVAAELVRLADRLSGSLSAEALLSLARARHPLVAAVVGRAVGSGESALRVSAVTATEFLGETQLLDLLLEDPEPQVRAAAFERVMTGAGDERAAALLRRMLGDSDPAVRATGLSLAEKRPLAPLELLTQAITRPDSRRLVEVGILGARAVQARAEAAPLERAAIVEMLEELASGGELSIRRAAVEGLAELQQPRPAIGSLDTGRSLDQYRELVRRTRRARWVELRTAGGRVLLELACGQAPLTCMNFLNLARQGFYDGLTWHRVVPDFVVQSGDPRGDGWGGPGYTIRDEINLLRYDRGVMGMAHSGPDTGGSQFFITLTPQPHLDGGYTAFGRVVGGWEVLQRIVQGDRIDRVVEVERGD